MKIKTSFITVTSFIITIISFILTIISTVKEQLVLSYFFGGLILLTWLLWITYMITKVYPFHLFSDKPKKPIQFPYQPELIFLEKRPHLIDQKNKKLLLQSEFLDNKKFSLLFWVYVTDDFINSTNNRYLFAYIKNTSERHKYTDSFYLGIKKANLSPNERDWRLVINGRDKDDRVVIQFSSNELLKGWKFFSIRWSTSDNKLNFEVDGGDVFKQQIHISSDNWPNVNNDEFLNIGGWPDWNGGLSHLNFFNLRVFDERLSDGDIKNLYNYEKEIVKRFKIF